MPTTTTDRTCACNCGRATRGEFVRGHRTAHAMALRQRILQGDRTAEQELTWRGWLNWNPDDDKAKPGNTAFGFEAEFFGIDRGEAVAALRRMRIPAMDDGYHHETRDYWRVTSDSSVSLHGNELVSPVLRVTKKPHFTLIKTAASTLKDAGGDVDKTCGLHVHHSAQNMTPLLVAELVTHYALFQMAIDSILPKSRRVLVRGTDTFNVKLPDTSSMNAILRNPSTTMEAIKQGVRGLPPRHSVVNLTALAAHNTIEFRQHSGSLNATKISNWVKFTRLFMDIGKKKSAVELVRDHSFDIVATKEQFKDIVKVLEYLGADDELTEYYIARRDTFSDNKTGDDEDTLTLTRVGDRARPEHPSDTEGSDEMWCDSCSMYHGEFDGGERDEENDY